MLHLISIWSVLVLSLFLINRNTSQICPWCHTHVLNGILNSAYLISRLLRSSAGVTPDTAPWALAVLGGCWPLAVSGLWQWCLVPVAAHP